MSSTRFRGSGFVVCAFLAVIALTPWCVVPAHGLTWEGWDPNAETWTDPANWIPESAPAASDLLVFDGMWLNADTAWTIAGGGISVTDATIDFLHGLVVSEGSVTVGSGGWLKGLSALYDGSITLSGGGDVTGLTYLDGSVTAGVGSSLGSNVTVGSNGHVTLNGGGMSISVIDGVVEAHGSSAGIGGGYGATLEINGRLELTGGADLPSQREILMGQGGGVSELVISGSRLTVDSDSIIGMTGSASVTISNGGGVGRVAALGDQAGSHGTVWVSDSGSTFSAVNAANQGQATLTVLNGAAAYVLESIAVGASSSADITVDNGRLEAKKIGEYGDVTLSIANGTTVESPCYGYYADSYVDMDMAGQGLTLDGGGFDGGTVNFGHQGKVDLTVSGASVTAPTTILGSMASGEAMMTMGGSSWDMSYHALTVGYYGKGRITASGSSISCGSLALGKYAGGTGRMTLSGSGGSINVMTDILVGDEGEGYLTIDPGNSVSARSLRIANDTGSYGEATIHSDVNLSGSFHVGRDSVARIQDAMIDATTAGMVTSYNGSRIELTNASIRGGNATGYPSLGIGGDVIATAGSSIHTDKEGYIWGWAGHTTSVSFDGAGGGLFVGGSLHTGTNGPTGIHLTGGADLEVGGNLSIGDYDTGDDGQLELEGFGVEASIGGTTLIGGRNGDGGLTVRNGARFTTDGYLDIGGSYSTGEVTLTGAGSIVTTNGNVYLGGNTEPSTLTVRDGAVLEMTDPNSRLLIYSKGVLTGDGTIRGRVDNYGTIRPGNSPGTLRIEGDFTHASGAALDVQLGRTAAEPYDRVQVTGAADVTGAINVSFSPDAEPLPGARFEVVQAGSVAGASAGTGQEIQVANRTFDVIWEPNSVFVEARRPKMYVLSVGVWDQAPGANWVLDGTLGAHRVAGAFAQFGKARQADPNTSLVNVYNLDLHTSQPDNKQKLTDSIQQIQSNITSNDIFVFYINCHGGPLQTPTADQDESPALAQLPQFDPSGVVTGYTPSLLLTDEYLMLGRDANSPDQPMNEYITDDEFSDLFRDPNGDWEFVEKLFLLDACFSGGFWGTDTFGDSGDLGTLDFAALISAADEEHVSWNYQFDGQNKGHSGILGYGVSKALEDLKDEPYFAYSELLDLTLVKGGEIHGSGLIQQVDSGFGEIDFHPASWATDDFDFRIGEPIVPEPATMALLAAGLVMLCARRYRRSRLRSVLT